MADAIPKHIGYIVDGNRRWAKKHGIPTYEGHLAGYNSLLEVVQATFEAGVSCVSLYVFSTENWKRDRAEIENILGLMLKVLQGDLKLFEEGKIRLRIMGSREGVNAKIAKAIDEAEARTAHYTNGTLALCFNYGGQAEIADALKSLIRAGVSADDVTPELISQHLYLPEIPPLDLVVRTSGEQRLSNFMLWRAAYSELLFLEKLWPDMTKDDVTAILEEYTRRGRRFGG